MTSAHTPPPDFARAWARALALLTRRAYSTREVATRLGRAGITPDITAAVVARLTELSLVDDARLAEAQREQLARQGRGPRAIAFALRRRGLGGHDAHNSAHASEPIAHRAAARLVARRFPDLSAPPQRARAMAFLARRGFGAEAARALIDAQVKDQPDRR